ncbi:unnamed protein product, partial [Citrullus colocynthis]
IFVVGDIACVATSASWDIQIKYGRYLPDGVGHGRSWGNITRDSNGAMVVAAIDSLPNSLEALDVEALALLFGLKLAYRAGCS